ncbi:MAG TPA: S41 family peptidase [Acidobacteriota bacterium]|nr:S41 family peptidase [Acidobacteriota bacterium]
MSHVQSFNRRIVLLSVLFMFLLVGICGTMAVYVLSDRGLHRAVSLAHLAVEVEHMYSGQLDWDGMFRSAMDEMFLQLDRYSSYVEPELFEQMDEEMTGSYGGIGVTVIPHQRGLMIMSVREGGPASRGGLLTGDVIIQADGVVLAQVSPERASSLLRGREDTEVAVKVLRPVSDDTLLLDITRSRIDLMHVPFAGFTPDSILYLRLLDFDAGASEELAEALDSLLADRKRTPCGVILDLRGNPGGLFAEAYRTANLFLEAGRFIVGTDSRSRWNREAHYSSGQDRTGGLPMAVMVDRGTASAAEIVAGALRQLGRAVLVGDTTFGKGLVQGFTRFPDGSGLRLTISRYYLDGDVYLNEFDSTLNDTGHGLVPDHYLRSVERSEFPRALENSLLLYKFAHEHQDEIIAASDGFRLSDDWLRRLERFAVRENFRFVSRATRGAQLLVDLSRLERARIQTVKAVGELLRRARADDARQFAKYADYIKMRLQQIACERRFGTYEAYARVLIHQRPEIQTASRLLREPST